MKSSDFIISLVLHLAVLVAILVFSANFRRAGLPDLGPVVNVRMTPRLPSNISGPQMPNLNVPSAAMDAGSPKEEPVKLKSITKKEKVEKKSSPSKQKKDSETDTKKNQANKSKPSSEETANKEVVSGTGVELADVSGAGSMEEYYNGPLGEYYLAYDFGFVTSRIRQNWNNPIKSNSPISCVIYFQITKSGEIQGVVIKKSSGNGLFDRYAEAAVATTKRLPALPQSFPDNEVLAVNLTFTHRP